MALSTCKAEYIAGSFTACQAMWHDSMSKELKIEVKKSIQLLMDNKYDINLAKHLVSYGRSKHIETKFHFLRELVNHGRIDVMYCKTKMQVVDILTKALKIDRFVKLTEALGVVDSKSF